MAAPRARSVFTIRTPQGQDKTGIAERVALFPSDCATRYRRSWTLTSPAAGPRGRQVGLGNTGACLALLQEEEIR
jgi:hypothetical protein